MSKRGNIPEMTSETVHDYLRQIGSQWTGQGTAMELGCWLGASSFPLLQGLVSAGYNLPYYCYDKWKANEQQIGIAQEWGIKLRDKQDLQPLFERFVCPVYNNVVCHRGRVEQEILKYKGGKIEICLFDAPKRNPVFNISARKVTLHFIPGVTIWGLLDYNFYKKHTGKEREELLAPVRFMEDNEKCFEKIMEWGDHCSCVFFRYKGGKINV